MDFEILGGILESETIASGRGIRELRRLNRIYGNTSWRRRKGIARIRLADGTVKVAEIHWYDGHGMGKKETKIKKYLR